MKEPNSAMINNIVDILVDGMTYRELHLFAKEVLIHDFQNWDSQELSDYFRRNWPEHFENFKIEQST